MLVLRGLDLLLEAERVLDRRNVHDIAIGYLFQGGGNGIEAASQCRDEDEGADEHAAVEMDALNERSQSRPTHM